MAYITSPPQPSIELAITACSIKQVSAQLDLSVSSIWEKLKPQSRYYDPAFPKPIKIGRATRFIQYQLNAYLAEKIRASSPDTAA